MIDLYNAAPDGNRSRPEAFASSASEPSPMMNGLLNSYICHDMARSAITRQRALGVSFTKIWEDFERRRPDWFPAAILGCMVCLHGEIEPLLKDWVTHECTWTNQRFELIRKYNRHFQRKIPRSWDKARDWLAKTDELVALFKKEALRSE